MACKKERKSLVGLIRALPNGEYPEKLVKGRERIYFEYFWNVFAADKTRSIPESEAYTESYAKPGRTHAA